MTSTDSTAHSIKFGYCRVSTEDQHPEVQETQLRQAGAERIFTDKGVSGRKASRPQWDRMLDQLRSGDTVMVTKLDRAGRSVQHLIELAAWLREHSVELVVTTQGIDTSTPTGRMLFYILAAIAEFETDLLRERTMEGLRQARTSAASRGWPRGMAPGGQRKLNDAQIAQLRRMLAEGKRPAEVLEVFPISRATLYRYADAGE